MEHTQNRNRLLHSYTSQFPPFQYKRVAGSMRMCKLIPCFPSPFSTRFAIGVFSFSLSCASTHGQWHKRKTKKKRGRKKNTDNVNVNGIMLNAVLPNKTTNRLNETDRLYNNRDRVKTHVLFHSFARHEDG